MPKPIALAAGGTRGIGLATGLAFAKLGMDVVLTHRWASVDDSDIFAVFDAAGVARPRVFEADIADEDATDDLLDRIGRPVDVFVPNVCVAARGEGNFQARTLRQSLAYSAWPLLRYVEAMERKYAQVPSHIIATSSDGHDHFYPGYDYVAASKALLEALCADLAVRFPRSRINAVRARQVDTHSFREMFPADSREHIASFSEFDLDANDVAHAIVALTQPAFAGVTGQTIVIDRGATGMDNLVCVAPRLLGMPAPWESIPNLPAAPSGRLWIVAGIAPTHGEFDVVKLGETEGLIIPNHVVLGIDWNSVSLPDLENTAHALVDHLQTAEKQGHLVHHALQIDRGDSPGIGLSHTLARYWNAWRVNLDTRVNFVATAANSDPRPIVDGLFSGAFDQVHGHRFVWGNR